jgi:uncharacterized phosphosugar-binding protein
MTAARYLDLLSERLTLLRAQSDSIQRAADLCATTIAAGGVVHVFGAGHSRMMCEEAYPRIGAVVGFHPVVELAVTYFTPVVGGSGLRQALFLERVPGYGKVIFDEADARAGDAVIVFSSSGVEHIVMDFVAAAKATGLPVIGVTSLDYSGVASHERGGARRLADEADIVIDNQVPVGDALVDVDGLGERVGASASVLNLAVMDAITAGTAAAMVHNGTEPLVFASPHLVGHDRSQERFDTCIAAYEQRIVKRAG